MEKIYRLLEQLVNLYVLVRDRLVRGKLIILYYFHRIASKIKTGDATVFSVLLSVKLPV